MSGNIKFIGENSSNTVQLPTSGRGGIFGRQSNTKGSNKALIKFADSFTEANTREQMRDAFPTLADKVPGKEVNKDERLQALKNLLMVRSVPKDDQDCSTFIVKKLEPKDAKLLEDSTNISSSYPFGFNPPQDENMPLVRKNYKKEFEDDLKVHDEEDKVKEAERNARIAETQNNLADLYSRRERVMMSNEDEDAIAGGKSRRRRRRSSKKARRSTNKKRKSRRGKRKSYKR